MKFFFVTISKITKDNSGNNIVHCVYYVYVGEKISMPENPQRFSWVFEGWLISGTTDYWNFATVPTEDIILEADWSFGMPIVGT